MSDERADAIPEAAVEAAAAALHEEWPRLGILSRVVVYQHPSKADLARVALAAAAPHMTGGGEADEPSDDEKINYWVGRWRETCEQLAEVRAELARAEPVLVAADRVHEAYEAMIEGRDVGRLPEWVSVQPDAERAPQPELPERWRGDGPSSGGIAAERAPQPDVHGQMLGDPPAPQPEPGQDGGRWLCQVEHSGEHFASCIYEPPEPRQDELEAVAAAICSVVGWGPHYGGEHRAMAAAAIAALDAARRPDPENVGDGSYGGARAVPCPACSASASGLCSWHRDHGPASISPAQDSARRVPGTGTLEP